jgi:DNA repair exonuclease SbcCD ATPase subunit
MRDIAYLLARPGQEIHALDLQAAAERAAPAAAQRRVDAGSADAVLDERARRELRDRVRELEEELAEAEGWTDTARAARLREELDFVRGELAAAFGLGGRARKLGDPAERARKAVKGRIDDALTRIERELPDLARHLRRSIRTGTFCMYAPVDPASWTF